MFQPQFFYEAGKARSGTALIPIKNASTFAFYVSTRVGNYIVDKGDGSAPFEHTVINKNKDFTNLTIFDYDSRSVSYSSSFTGNMSLKFPQGLKDVFSVATTKGDTGNVSKLNIADIETFFKQFPNLYSVFISEFLGSTAVIKGDLAKLPNSVERVLIQYTAVVNSATDFTLNLSNYSTGSNLKFFSTIRNDSPLKVLGDLGKTPSTLQFLNIAAVHAGSEITYTAGKVWASSFDTLYLPIALTPTENDNLLIDANNSVTTAIGGKLWDLKGFRTSASDTAISGLIAKGFTVNCTRISDTMLTMPLSANLLDSSSYLNHATMVGTETHSLGGLVTSTGNYAYIPNKTSLDFGTGSLRFGCTVKFSAITGTKGIIGKSYFGSIKGRYGITIDGGLIYGLSQMTAGSVINTTNASTYNDGNFHTIEVICNRTTGKQTLTIDGVLINTTSFTPSSDNLALNQKFHIGAYGNTSGGIVASSELNGIIKDVFVNKF